MADRPTKVIVDCSTGEETIIPLTDEEIAAMKAVQAEAAAQQAEAEAEAKAKAEARESALAKLTKLGLTEDEANALIGV